MTGDQRTIQQWTVRIDGIDQKTVKPGDASEIGRKPLRPLPDDGTERLEIADGTRSMSKRHATFAVSQNGGGTVRDLGSTNGSYVVRGNGDLMRLPPNVDFLLPTSPMRLQFGDVPVDSHSCGRQPAERQVRRARPGPDTLRRPSSRSLTWPTCRRTDIPDLRAGETDRLAISAATVRKRVGELNADASQTCSRRRRRPRRMDWRRGFPAAGAAAQRTRSSPFRRTPPCPSMLADAAVSTETATSDTASPEP